jgi:hypothetical protein
MTTIPDTTSREAKQHAKDAAKALADLHIFHAVIALMESSLLSSDAFSDEAQIVRIAKRGSSKALERYDEAMGKVKS